MKLTVYDKSNSHPALTYKGKRIIRYAVTEACIESDTEQGTEPARRKQAVYRQGRRQAQGLVHVRLG